MDLQSNGRLTASLRYLFLLAATITCLLIALASVTFAQEDVPAQTVVEKEESETGIIQDDPCWYEGQDPYSVITMYLTVMTGNEADGTNHTWKEVNAYSADDFTAMGVDRYKVDGILQIDEIGDGITEQCFGYGEETPNVSVQIRGQTSSRRDQKSYKIRIKSGKGAFRQQRTLDLNKHVSDPYRFLNKLSYDLLIGVPHLFAGRTQFVHLYVKDTTSAGSQDFEDYGLFTMVEQVNRTYLKNHGLDENGQLYKATFFEWESYEEVMIPSDDPKFDSDAFEQYLEIKGDGDTAKLREIIEKLHNLRIPIQEIVAEHFDAENLCYWMASQILIGNYDAGARNLFWYSPLNTDRFYIICWDMDASFKKTYYREVGRKEGGSWEQGMTQFLGLLLVNRMMKETVYREMLSSAVEELHKNYINPKIVDQKASKYVKIVKPYIFREPDISHEALKPEDYDRLTSMIGQETDLQYQAFLNSMNAPWPFFVGLPEYNRETGNLTLSWGRSYEPHGEAVTYRYELSADPLYGKLLESGDHLLIPNAEVPMLEPGTYYLRVIASNESGYDMDCFDYVSVHGYGKIYASYGFLVHEDGSTEPFTGGLTFKDDQE